jgi:transposase
VAKLLPDELWAIISPLLPAYRPSPKGGRPPISHRQALTGILFVLKTGLPWEDLPAEMGCGSGMACWRRLRDWQADGTWDRVHAALLERLAGAGKLDWSKCAIDSSSVRAVFGGPPPARTPRTGGRRAASTT